jgi:hypothetical protein
MTSKMTTDVVRQQQQRLGRRSKATFSTKTRASMTTGVLLALLVFGASLHQTDASFFILGGACVFGLKTAETVLSSTIAARNLIEAVKQVETLCHYMQRYSIEGVVLYDILPRVKRLIMLTIRANSNLCAKSTVDEFEDVVRELARISVQVVTP